MKKRPSPANCTISANIRSSGLALTQMLRAKYSAAECFHLRGVAEILVAVVDPLEPFPDPSGHRFDRAHAQAREALEHAVVHHRGQRDARILHVHHRDVHEAGIASAVPLAAGVVGMADEMDTHGEVEVLRRGPDWI